MNQAENNPVKGYHGLFTPLRAGKLLMKNRMVALPVHTGFAHTDGHVSSWMIDFYTRLAESGVAMVIVANTAVSWDGIVTVFNLRADQNQFIPGLARLATAIKKTGALACLQLNHAGRFARTRQPLLPSPITRSNLSFNIESLKEFMEFFPFEKRFNLTRYLINQVKTWRRPMTQEDRDRVIKDFSAAAFRACEAGFDMVELHGANGYLLCQYLSGFTNQIEIGFGGDFTRRTAFPLAVIQAVKKKLPQNFPLGFRLLLHEWVPGGIDLTEALAFAQILENQGIDYISASVSTYNSLFARDVLKKMDLPAYLAQDMARLTAQVTIPTIMAGRITTPWVAEKLIQEGTTDLIGLGRPLRTDPGWVAKAKNPGQKIIECINCNACLKRVVLEKGFNCIRWPKLRRQRTDLAHKLLTRNDRVLWIIADIKDIQIFQNSLALLIQRKKQDSYPKIIFLQEAMEDQSFLSLRQNFIHWIQTRLDLLGFSSSPRCTIVRESKNNWEKAVSLEINQGNYGRIFTCSNPFQPWRERLLYNQREKVMIHLGTHPHPQSVLVPIDLSDTTLLVMKFLEKTEKTKFTFHFVHVMTHPTGIEIQQWNELKHIAEFNGDIPLDLIFTRTTVVSALVKLIETQKYGTLVMGKRGLSNIKRWLLGSVSAGVLRALTDQSLILID